MRGMILTLAAAALMVASCGRSEPGGASGANDSAAEASATGPVDLAAAASGLYTPDPKHRHLIFRYGHQGYSVSYVRWRDWTAELHWDAEEPEASTISVTINAEEVDSGVDEFDGHLRDARFFDVANHPDITFVSRSLQRTGDNTGRMTGDLTIKGVTKPVTLDVKLNKAAFEESAGAHKLGFSATGTIKRSEFGLDYAIPFVDDNVELIIEAEFLSPKAT